MSPRYTPGVGGYAVAYIVSCAVAPSILLATTVDDVPSAWSDVLDGLAVLVVYGQLGAVFCLVAGIPLGVVGGALVHLVCRRIGAQWVHVATAGAVGAVGGPVYGALVLHGIGSDLGSAHVVVAVGVAAAAGRAAVIPLVRARRRRLAPNGVLRVL